MLDGLCERLGVDGQVARAAARAFERAANCHYEAQAYNRLRVVEAFMAQGIVESDVAGSVGYGYDDAARAHYEALLANLFGTQSALARLSLVSGTHAIVSAIRALVAPGRTLLSVIGTPYDTLRHAIVGAPNALVNSRLKYQEIALAEGAFDTVTILEQLQDPDVSAIFVQRSRGYAPRPSIGIKPCEALFSQIRDVRPDVAILVDNCYGEFVETREPTHAGADLAAGSLIKNLGGGLAPAGAYIVGKAQLIEQIANHHYAPGLGAALGPTLGTARAMLHGLFVAPLVVEQTLRGLDFASALFSELGYDVDPQCGAARTDTVQAIRLGSEQRVLQFAAGLQRAMPVNAKFRPEPGAVPGYAEPVVMSSGAFISGATSELSCDAPLREPFEVYLQGGLISEHTMAGALLAAQALYSGAGASFPKKP